MRRCTRYGCAEEAAFAVWASRTTEFGTARPGPVCGYRCPRHACDESVPEYLSLVPVEDLREAIAVWEVLSS